MNCFVLISEKLTFFVENKLQSIRQFHLEFVSAF